MFTHEKLKEAVNVNFVLGNWFKDLPDFSGLEEIREYVNDLITHYDPVNPDHKDILYHAAAAVLAMQCVAQDETTKNTPVFKKWIPVNSQAIHSLAFDEDKGIIGIQFINGSLAQAPGTSSDFIKFLTADSVGRYYNNHYRNKTGTETAGSPR